MLALTPLHFWELQCRVLFLTPSRPHDSVQAPHCVQPLHSPPTEKQSKLIYNLQLVLLIDMLQIKLQISPPMKDRNFLKHKWERTEILRRHQRITLKTRNFWLRMRTNDFSYLHLWKWLLILKFIIRAIISFSTI